MKSRSMGNYLVFAQDPGGGKFMIPVLKPLISLDQYHNPIILVHPLSRELFEKSRIAFNDVTASVGPLPISVSLWEKFLKDCCIHQVFCTTSSPYLDLTNSRLIIAARNLKISTLGIMDHWKGFDRFYNHEKIDFMPDHICCIDSYTGKKFKRLGITSNRVHVVGHPRLEVLSRQRQKKTGSKRSIRILLVSQPVVSDKSFEGIFFKRLGGYRLIDNITDCLNNFSAIRNISLHTAVRLHPKEKSNHVLPNKITIDENRDMEISLREYDIFIGLDSMALVEALVMGKYVISLNLPELKKLSNNLIPIEFSGHIKRLSDLPPELNTAINRITRWRGEDSKHYEIFKNATKRTLSVLTKLLQNSLAIVHP